VLICRPARYTIEPRLTSLVLDDHEVDICKRGLKAALTHPG
jgi:hypothetical protein